MRHLDYSLRYSVAQINSSLLTITIYSSVITTLAYNDTQCSVPFMTLLREFDCVTSNTRLLILFSHLHPNVYKHFPKRLKHE
jgi:hypothetical protein